MEAVVDFEQLSGTQNETFVKELSVAGMNVLETIQFQRPYSVRPHWNSEIGLNWDDGHFPYNQLSPVLNEVVAGFAHLYAYGDSKCTLISQLLSRPVHNLEDFYCPSSRYFRPKFSCTKPCHRNPSFRCATRHAHSLYEWLVYHLQKMSYVTCPDDKTRHTPRFVSGIKRRGSATFTHSASRWYHGDVLRSNLHAASLALSSRSSVQPSIPTGYCYVASSF